MGAKHTTEAQQTPEELMKYQTHDKVLQLLFFHIQQVLGVWVSVRAFAQHTQGPGPDPQDCEKTESSKKANQTNTNSNALIL